MKPILFLLLVMTVSCGVKKKGPEYGKTTVNDLVHAEGEPIKKEEIPIDNGVVFHYADNVKYQIQGELVEVGFKNPKGDEKNLLYWKHKFKDCQTKSIEHTQAAGSHTEKEIEFSCPAEGISVIHVKNSSTVLRVV